jgi:histidinol-phosphate aminotransferase
MAALAYGRTEVVSAQPTFRQLHAFAGRLGARLVEVPVDAELRHDLDAMRARIGPSTGLVYVVNPNNPTGTVVPGSALRAFLRGIAEPTIAVVDEAYIELAAPGATESMIDLVREGRNVVVCRTFSKVHGLAGLRVGYGLARPDVARQLRDWRQTIPSTPGIAAARASLDDTAFLADCTRQLRADRARIERACDARGWRRTQSECNFVFVDVQRPLAEFAKTMDARGIAVGRLFEGWPTWCRLTVGTTAETTRLVEVLRDA